MYVESTYGKGSTFGFQIEQKIINNEPLGNFQEDYRNSLSQRAEYHEKFIAPNAVILVVDDTAMNLTVVKGLLKQTKIRIDTAESGEKCLDAVKKRKYDVIFLDHRMPGMDGIETLKAMQKMADNINQEALNGAKKVRDRIYLQEDKFNQYCNITHFIAMGFSFNDIDMPYIEKIWSVNRQKEDADWTLYWYSSREDDLMKKKVIELGVNENSIITLKWE